MAWTDERLEERFDTIDRQFGEVNRRIDELKADTNRGFEDVGQQLAELRKGLADINTTLIRGGFGLSIALLATIIAMFLKGG